MALLNEENLKFLIWFWGWGSFDKQLLDRCLEWTGDRCLEWPGDRCLEWTGDRCLKWTGDRCLVGWWWLLIVKGHLKIKITRHCSVLPCIPLLVLISLYFNQTSCVFSVQNLFIRSLHLYISKIIEKTLDSNSRLIRHGLMSFWLLLPPVASSNIFFLQYLIYKFHKTLWELKDLTVHFKQIKRGNK